jgi:hypothetical protein
MRRKRNLGRLLGFVTLLGSAALGYRADTLSHHEAQQSPQRPPVETVSLPAASASNSKPPIFMRKLLMKRQPFLRR